MRSRTGPTSMGEPHQSIGTVFAEVHVDTNGAPACYRRKTGSPTCRAVLSTPAALDRCGTERETGLKGRGVATVRLTQDERGWLRLAV